jgi:hypothetical protein
MTRKKSISVSFSKKLYEKKIIPLFIIKNLY